MSQQEFSNVLSELNALRQHVCGAVTIPTHKLESILDVLCDIDPQQITSEEQDKFLNSSFKLIAAPAHEIFSTSSEIQRFFSRVIQDITEWISSFPEKKLVTAILNSDLLSPESYINLHPAAAQALINAVLLNPKFKKSNSQYSKKISNKIILLILWFAENPTETTRSYHHISYVLQTCRLLQECSRPLMNSLNQLEVKLPNTYEAETLKSELRWIKRAYRLKHSKWSFLRSIKIVAPIGIVISLISLYLYHVTFKPTITPKGILKNAIETGYLEYPLTNDLMASYYFYSFATCKVFCEVRKISGNWNKQIKVITDSEASTFTINSNDVQLTPAQINEKMQIVVWIEPTGIFGVSSEKLSARIRKNPNIKNSLKSADEANPEIQVIDDVHDEKINVGIFLSKNHVDTTNQLIAIRNRENLRELMETESGKPLAKVPHSCYFYLPAEDLVGPGEKLKLKNHVKTQRFKTTQDDGFEVHAHYNGSIFLLGFTSQIEASRVSESNKKAVTKLLLYPSWRPKSDCIVILPVTKINVSTVRIVESDSEVKIQCLDLEFY